MEKNIELEKNLERERKERKKLEQILLGKQREIDSAHQEIERQHSIAEEKELQELIDEEIPEPGGGIAQQIARVNAKILGVRQALGKAPFDVRKALDEIVEEEEKLNRELTREYENLKKQKKIQETQTADEKPNPTNEGEPRKKPESNDETLWDTAKGGGEDDIQKKQPETPPITEPIQEPEPVEEAKLTQEVDETLLLALFKEGKKIKVEEAAKTLGKDGKTVKEWMEKLKEKNLIRQRKHLLSSSTYELEKDIDCEREIENIKAEKIRQELRKDR